MNITLVINRVCKGSNGFHCTLCSIDIDSKDSAFKHITDDQEHIVKMKTAVSLKHLNIDENTSIELINNGVVPVSNRDYICTLCSCCIPQLKFVSEHITGKKHITKREKLLTLDKDKLCLVKNDQDNSTKDCCNNDNSKTQDENTSHDSMFKCNTLIQCGICKNYLTSEEALLYHKMFHLRQRNDNVNDIIHFFMQESRKYIYCSICNCYLTDENNLDKHLKSKSHKNRLIIFRCPSNKKITNMLYLNSTLYLNANIAPNVNNIGNTLNMQFNRNLYQLYNLTYNTYFNAFQASVQNHVRSNYKLLEMNTNILITQMQKYNQLNNRISIQRIQDYICFICNFKFENDNLLTLHYNNDYIHRYRMAAINLILKDKHIKFVSHLNNEVLKCTKCQIHLTELNGATTHLFQMQHITEIGCDNKNTNVPEFINSINNLNKLMYTCPYCEINALDDYTMVQHLESDYHNYIIHKNYVNVENVSLDKNFFCPVCQVNYSSDGIFLEHIYQNHNLNIFKNAIPNNNMMMSACSTINTNLNLNNCTNLSGINQILNNLPNRSLVNSNQQIVNKYDKHLNDKSSKTMIKNLIKLNPAYVKLCIETGEENIFNINEERMKKLQLGIHLTFPLELNRCCIPCGYEISGEPAYFYEHLRSEVHETNLQEMVDNDMLFKNYEGQYSNLELAKSYMYEDSDELIKCFACDINVKNSDESIKSHIDSITHCNNYQPFKNSADGHFQLFKNIFENLWYYIENFICNICCSNYSVEVDYITHLESEKHLKEVKTRILEHQSLQFDCCIVCSSFWYGKSDQYISHCRKSSHNYILKSRNFTVPEMPDSGKKFLTNIEETIENLLIESNESIDSTKNIVHELLKSVETVVKPKYPRAKAYLYGSRISYLALKSSDVDIYLDCLDEYKIPKTANKCQELLITVQECFYKHQDIWIIKDIVLSSRVPIIKLQHRDSDLNCDISFSDGLNIEKSRILGYYINAYLPCRKLILYLKKWMLLCQMTGKRYITTFALSWLVIFYFQVQGILPDIQSLIIQQNQSHIVAGWETGISKITPINETNCSIRELLKGFFLFYSNFNYLSDVACPFLGKIMKKSQFSDIDNLSDEMNTYITRIKKEKIEIFRIDSPMCIQEPIDLTQNLTRSITKLHLRMFKQYCAESACLLEI